MPQWEDFPVTDQHQLENKTKSVCRGTVQTESKRFVLKEKHE